MATRGLPGRSECVQGIIRSGRCGLQTFPRVNRDRLPALISKHNILYRGSRKKPQDIGISRDVNGHVKNRCPGRNLQGRYPFPLTRVSLLGILPLDIGFRAFYRSLSDGFKLRALPGIPELGIFTCRKKISPDPEKNFHRCNPKITPESGKKGKL